MVHDPVTFPMVASRATVIDTGLSFKMTPPCSSIIFSHDLFKESFQDTPWPQSFSHSICSKRFFRKGGVHGRDPNIHRVNPLGETDGGRKSYSWFLFREHLWFMNKYENPLGATDGGGSLTKLSTNESVFIYNVFTSLTKAFTIVTWGHLAWW